jgi:DNA-binding response OmpR family regulator
MNTKMGAVTAARIKTNININLNNKKARMRERLSELTKPFNPMEMVARVNAQLRRFIQLLPSGSPLYLETSPVRLSLIL